MDRDELNGIMEDERSEIMAHEVDKCVDLNKCCRAALNGAVELGVYDDPILMRPYRMVLFYCPECGNPLEQYPGQYFH